MEKIGDNMLLKSLYLKNYRTYKGPEEIQFATGDQNVTIIKGNNEVGKTTIMNAITWCLYGVEYYKNEGNEPIWSKSTSYELDIGDEDTTEVILTMEDSKGKEVKFIRELLFYKNDNGQCRKDSEDSKILVNEMPVTFPSTYIRKHLPKEIREYFLFDGEQLESYFSAERNDNIKKSVYQLSQLDILEKILKHLKKCKNDFDDELEDLNPNLGRLHKKETQLVENIEKNEEMSAQLKSDNEVYDAKIKDYSERIKRFGENPTVLIERKEKLKSERDKLDKKISSAEETRDKFLANHISKILSISPLLHVRDICKDLEEKGYIPARFKKEFLKYLLDEHECICGADLSEGTDGYNKMVQLYEQTSVTTDIADKVNLLLGNVNSIIDNFPKTFEDNLTKKLKNIEELNSNRKEVDKEISEIDVILEGINEEEVKKLQRAILKYEKLIKDNLFTLGQLDKQIANDKEKLVDIRKDIEKEEEKAGNRLQIQSSLDLCNEAISEIKFIYESLEEDIHKKLQELTSFEFGNMHWKEFYESVEIDRNYNVKIRKQGGYIVPNDLSKGGQLVLALSFMTALNSLSGFGLPILIDTPLGRLDDDIKENIGKYLPEYTRNKQVTLLVTGSEYSDAFRKEIRDYVGKEYELNYIQEKDGITTIDLKK